MKQLSRLEMKAVKGGIVDAIGRCTVNHENGSGTVYACDEIDGTMFNCFQRLTDMCLFDPNCVGVGDCYEYPSE